MKRRFLKAVALILCISAPTVAVAAIYQWKDDKGVIHFTDDGEKIPQRYENRVREVEKSPAQAEKPQPKAAATAAPQPPQPAAAPQAQPAAAPQAQPAAAPQAQPAAAPQAQPAAAPQAQPAAAPQAQPAAAPQAQPAAAPQAQPAAAPQAQPAAVAAPASVEPDQRVQELRAMREALPEKKAELAKLHRKWLIAKGRNPSKEEVEKFEKKRAKGEAKLEDNPYINKNPLSSPGPARVAYYKKLEEIKKDEERIRVLESELGQ